MGTQKQKKNFVIPNPCQNSKASQQEDSTRCTQDSLSWIGLFFSIL